MYLFIYVISPYGSCVLLTIVWGHFILKGSTTLMLHWLFASRQIPQQLEQVYCSVQVAVCVFYCLITVHVLQQAADYCWGQRTGHEPCALQECLLASRPHVTRGDALVAPDH